MRGSIRPGRRSGAQQNDRLLWLRRLDLRRSSLVIVTVLSVGGLISAQFAPDRVRLRLGERSLSEVRAARSVTFIDSEATERLRDAAASSVPTVYDPDPQAGAAASVVVSDVFTRIRRLRSSGLPTDPAARRKLLATELGWVFARGEESSLLSLPANDLNRAENTCRDLVDSAMKREIRSNTDDRVNAQSQFEMAARRALGGQSTLQALCAIAAQAIRPNRLMNVRRTERAQETARRGVRPVEGQVRDGEIVLRRDDVFTQRHFDRCAALGLTNPRPGVVSTVSVIGLVSLMVLVLALYMKAYRPGIYAETRAMVLLSLTGIACVLGLKVFGALLGLPLSVLQFGYLSLMLVTAAAMLISTLLDRGVAIVVCGMLAVLSGLILNHEIRFPVMTFVASVVAVMSVRQLRSRTELLRATGALAGANVALVWLMAGILGDTLGDAGAASMWALLAALLAIPMFWLGVAVLEKPFGILTDVWLMELAASEHPLLRKLCLTAPGTYAHSIMVGNLAEAAAEAIGASPLLARVGAYYHDVGKLRRPHCFIENQAAGNIHDRLNPTLSALVVASHVRDGLEEAQEHRLPGAIRAIIREHHGTTLIRYFYHQAMAEQGDSQRDPVLEQQFRYDGPRPQSRESGIIMLADSVEAAARSMHRPSAGRVQALVESVVRDKMADGQLDECPITLQDIRRAEAAFVRVLTGMLHGRLDLPSGPRGEAAISDSSEGTARADHDTEPVGAASCRSASAPGGSERAEPAVGPAR